ncbi:hypothetical protein COCSUDRAFT_56561 [Coccomyxa subellipsoidea C-169]|uniref:Major facilitator superfamily (MFS) profile domain-containing protein n=1 Tax=Coccomyxa subellipsoidea (strain C-169) TaxID=574566 RepID=I0YSG9_COCSC|nr:hypothetical protein COCSUDRAFT_56561 [Coccomyxa subellipsoidea C-169]EIE21338.1 hypothetical protein COCSUDRAFT_56561 [Coccomyxa subellipsoidea C-169]|eukprot:XP_005645882.1 hypothetical protein COCSUDRAFT_56561 [Coccomyxa subellipsoidea C-169]
MTVILIILAAAITQIKAVSIWLFIVMYALTFFFANFGPNATTFVTPVELFTTKYRSTLHGISAACGLCCTIFVPETKGMHLEDAALHSKSHFSQMLSSCGIEQVNPAIEDIAAESNAPAVAGLKEQKLEA